MGDKRKLQGEIDKCLKKVNEGVEAFEETWHKVQQAVNANQKDKFEGDLKKEIKRLQRLRDQIKSWLASNDIKDKRALQEHRRLIEVQMERFKIVERETKTKAYSKEGLGQVAKIDPKEKEKDDACEFLSDTIERLSIQVDQLESDIESIQQTNKKKKPDKEKQDRVDDIKSNLTRHRLYIKRIEYLNRLLNNNILQPDKVKAMQEDLQYYTSSWQDPDFVENEELFDEFTFDELSDVNPDVINRNDDDDHIHTPSPRRNSGSKSNSVSSPLTNSNVSTPSSSQSNLVKPTAVKPPAAQQLNFTSQSSATSQSRTYSGSSIGSSSSKVSVLSNSAVPVHSATPQAYSTAAGSNLPVNIPDRSINTSSTANTNILHDVTSKSPSPPMISSQQTSIVSSLVTNSTNGPTFSSQSNEPDLGLSSQTANHIPGYAFSNNYPLSSSLDSTTPSFDPSILTSSTALTSGTDRQINGSSFNEESLFSSGVNSLATTASTGSFHVSSDPILLTNSQSSTVPSMDLNVDNLTALSITDKVDSALSEAADSLHDFSAAESALLEAGVRRAEKQATTTETVIQPLLGVAPLGRIPLTKEHVYQQTMLDAAFQHLPHSSDSERLRPYLPHNPCPTPAYYIKEPLPNSDTIDFFERLTTETLFFIFYYLEGTKAQYMAAKALKKQSWRFHTKYMMWFQRHEEPKTITDEYEQGAYVYFDYEKWAQRRKEGFTFEYRFLEDRDLK